MPVTKPPKQFAERLLAWFDQHGRHDLPWQHPRTPYRVWISEIMLQQTQVTTVIPYFQRFMDRFPTVGDLAAASQDDVLALWTGLGYYARARHLHAAAQQIVNSHAGNIPDDLDALCALPGIGRSTAGAILSLAYQQPATILDGNVKRVLTRLTALDLPPSAQREKILWHLATEMTPQRRNDDYTQAIMDLGATLCRRGTPDCHRCPFQQDCQGHLQGIAKQLPVGKKRRQLPVNATIMLLVKNSQGALLLEQRPPAGLWGGLWCPPQIDTLDHINNWLQQQGFITQHQQALPSFRHTFSHFHLDITPILINLEKATAIADDQRQWFHPTETAHLGLPAPVKRLLQSLSH